MNNPSNLSKENKVELRTY